MPKRKKEVTKLAKPRKVVIVAEQTEEVNKIVFENVSNNDFTNEFHSLPCRIEYDGPAKVSQYFITERLGDDTRIATFRGRILNGVQQQFPDGYRLFVAVEKEIKDNSRVFEVNGSAKSFMLWEYDRKVGHQSPLVQAIDYLSIAEAFARDDD
ncbi:Ribonuclease H2 non-catalytic subunit (Ylr154p-like) family protein [Brugia pahangi]|uniref:Bet_v_1 domain-containing protein n=1 Tax=Brugia pahangi TaxID=6280 RepID=A0A0N4TW91_BRUPA|nr:unnamed protein product [Brugia pahangi]